MEPLGADDPSAIGAYRLLGRLGAGGMGRVYLGRSDGGRTVAVKVVHPHFAADEQFRARFRREVQSARRLGGSWTAPVLDADPEADIPWVATGYVAGPSLAQAVTEFGSLPERSVRALGAGLAQALDQVHRLGLVHRDVKPSNVLLTLDGPLLIDFGIARATDGTASLTSTGVSVGSPGYMAPEQIVGDGAAAASDIFSLGAVLAYAATGVSPFGGNSSAALLYKVVHEEPELATGLTGELRELVATCLAKSAEHRPTPEEITRRLAGEREDAAAGLIRAGWLPQPVVEQVSRRAVEVLNLEARGEDAAGARPSGPGPQRSGSSGAPASASSGGAAAGGFGPPDPSYAAGAGSSYPSGGGAEDGGATGPYPRPTGPYPGPTGPYAVGSGASDSGESGLIPFDTAARVPGQRQDRRSGATDDRPAKERSVSLSGAFGGKERPHRMSCTLVLSVAGALAAATTAAFVFQLLPGGGEDTNAGAKPPAASDSPAPLAGVSKPFLGTWEGDIRQRNGAPNGSVTVKITPGVKGETVAHLTYDAIVTKCHARGELRAATPRKLTLHETESGDGGALCTGQAATVTLTRQGAALQYASDDERGGRPTARLTRAG